ncbi:MAG: hypothetical protein AAF125_13010, partial [Chloroflexota bacterium]
MSNALIRRFTLAITVSLFLAVLAIPASSQNRVFLNNNAGINNSIWEIQGEPTLIMNGFDLTPTSLRL